MKMKRLLFYIIYAHSMITVLSKINYCGAKMCANTDMHTFCKYTESTPGPLCIGFMPAILTKEEKLNIISRLNHRRNDAALGLLGYLPSAGDMLTLRWVEELAREAQLCANQCFPPKFPEEHDVCRDLYSIPVGQNVASVIGEAPGLRVESLVDLWYMQGRHYKGNITSYVPSSHNKSYYGDFAQMLWSRTFMVGCGRSRFMTVWQDRPRTVERLVCNLAPRGPRPKHPLWQPARPASLCPPRTRPATQYPGLCAVYDDHKFMDKNSKMSLEETIILSTLLELERNTTFENVGHMDEIYLMKLVAIAMERSNKEEQRVRSVDVKEIFRKLGFNEDDHDDSMNKKIDIERRKIRRYMSRPIKSKRKLRTVGRPKAYYLYELNKEEDDNGKKYFVDINPVIYKEINTANVTTNNDKRRPETSSNSESDSKTTTEDVKTMNPETDETVSSDLQETISAEFTDNSMNVTLDEDYSSEISDQVIEEYLSDPETARQLQESLLGMEQTMSGQTAELHSTFTSKRSTTPPSTPAKVRRELRPTESEDFKKFMVMYERTRQTTTEDAAEEDRDDVETMKQKAVLGAKEGTVLQTLLGYLPNMKTLGLTSGPVYGSATLSRPSFFLHTFYIVLFSI